MDKHDTREVERIIAVDPGPEESAFVHYWPGETRRDPGQVCRFETLPNDELLALVQEWSEESARAWSELGVDALRSEFVVEKITSYGKPVSESVFGTVFWSGKFAQAWGPSCVMYSRRTVKKVLLGKDKGGDPQVRAAVISWFGGKNEAIGKKATPGPLHEMVYDQWQACGLALAFVRELWSGAITARTKP